MVRIRTIKPEFWTSDDISSLSIEDRLLFIGLWSYVDDNGVGRDEDHLIIAALFAHDMFTNAHECSLRVHGGLKRISEAGLITRFDHDGRRFLQINAWEKHQKVNRPTPPRFPRYDADFDTLSEDSVSPQKVLSAGTEEQGNRGTGEVTPLTPQRGAERATPSRESKRSAKTPVDSPEFDRFWHAYPRRTAKPQARRAWERAVKRASVEVILAGAERYAAECAALGTEDRYVAHPATWLNNDRWDDQPTRPPASREDGATQRARGWLKLGLDAMNATQGEPPAAQHPQIGPSQPHGAPNTPTPLPAYPEAAESPSEGLRAAEGW